MLLGNYFYTDNVAGQFIAAPPTCPGETFNFSCTVTGNMRGITTWIVNGSIECNLWHRYNFSSICGPSDSFIARPGTGFGTSDATSFSSTLSGTATTSLDGTLVECFGPANNVYPGNKVNGSTLQMLGKYYGVLQYSIWSYMAEQEPHTAHVQNCLFDFCSHF